MLQPAIQLRVDRIAIDAADRVAAPYRRSSGPRLLTAGDPVSPAAAGAHACARGRRVGVGKAMPPCNRNRNRSSALWLLCVLLGCGSNTLLQTHRRRQPGSGIVAVGARTSQFRKKINYDRLEQDYMADEDDEPEELATDGSIPSGATELSDEQIRAVSSAPSVQPTPLPFLAGPLIFSAADGHGAHSGKAR
eukprot:SAG31_NODE_2139_length_6349_cov_2.773636_5_plen_192_part_00